MPTLELQGETETRYRFHKEASANKTRRSRRRVVWTNEFNPDFEINALDAEAAVKIDFQRFGHVFKPVVEVVLPEPVVVAAQKAVTPVHVEPQVEVAVEPQVEPQVEPEPVEVEPAFPDIETFSIKTLKAFLTTNTAPSTQIDLWLASESDSDKPRKGVLKVLKACG